MPATYHGLDLECFYPDNWHLREETIDNETAGFTIESPDAAFFSLLRYPWTCAPRAVLEEALPAMQSEYEQLESSDFDPQIDIDDSRGLEVNFYCLDFLVTAQLIAFTVRPYTYLVQTQAEDRSFDRLRLVFRAMLVTVLKSLGREVKTAL
jgi:hypothetical protein